MNNDEYLECEKYHVFLILIFIAGFYGAYTLTIKGGVFANAATANMVLLGIAVATSHFNKAKLCLLSFIGFMIGTMISEHLALKVKKTKLLRWDTLFILIQIVCNIILAFLPESAPATVYQFSINILCAMQFNTFRQAEGIGMATIFITNHTRMTASWLTRWLRKPSEKQYFYKFLRHGGMVFSFTLGATVCAFLGTHFHTKTLLFSAALLTLLFIDLLHADLIKERHRITEVPHGH